MHTDPGSTKETAVDRRSGQAQPFGDAVLRQPFLIVEAKHLNQPYPFTHKIMSIKQMMVIILGESGPLLQTVQM
ncbi:hypothetical protein B5C26_22310 [Photorhabdus luminescens]|nr:hypothetical protein B5C26_22310 [Photorhabdus luminescens]